MLTSKNNIAVTWFWWRVKGLVHPITGKTTIYYTFFYLLILKKIDTLRSLEFFCGGDSSTMSNVKDSFGSVDHRSHWCHMCSHDVCPEYLRHILLVQVWPRNPPQGFGKRLWLKHVMLKKKDLVVSTWITDISCHKTNSEFPLRASSVIIPCMFWHENKLHYRVLN